MNRVDAPPAEQLPQVQPLDEHNRALLRAVHPPEWRNPQPAGRYNLVVVGAGTAGLVTAAGAAGLGAKVALVERGLLGGDCLNVGCVPSKAMIRCARALAAARDGGRFGVRIPDGVELDFAAVMERMRRLRATISPHDSAQRFTELGVDVFLGPGCFTGPDRLRVEGAELRFARACIATGARPVEPSIPGLAETGFLTNETVFSLTELPGRLAVIGGGPIGCEMAQTFARFGADVHLIERNSRIMKREDEEAAAIVQEALRRDGVTIHLERETAEVRPADDGKRLVFGGGAGELVVDELLIGAGRAPNVQNLGLEDARVEHDERGGVTVDDRLRTTNRRIYAAGDVCSRYKFTHAADALARIVIRNALFLGRSRASALVVPWCTYTEPEVAHAGLSEAQARDRGLDVDTIRVELGDVDRAVLDGDEQGFLKVHLKAGSDRILGAVLVSRHAGETISELTAAMVNGIGLGGLGETIHPYPTQAEIVRKAADQHNRGRLTPLVARLLRTFLAWRR